VRQSRNAALPPRTEGSLTAAAKFFFAEPLSGCGAGYIITVPDEKHQGSLMRVLNGKFTLTGESAANLARVSRVILDDDALGYPEDEDGSIFFKVATSKFSG
jgi:hypothetical protein